MQYAKAEERKVTLVEKLLTESEMKRRNKLAFFSGMATVGLSAAAPVAGKFALSFVDMGTFGATAASYSTLAAAGAVGGAVVFIPVLLMHWLINDKVSKKHPSLAFALNATLFLGSAYAAMAIGSLIFNLGLKPMQELMFTGNLGIYGAALVVALCSAVVYAITTTAYPACAKLAHKGVTADKNTIDDADDPAARRRTLSGEENEDVEGVEEYSVGGGRPTGMSMYVG